MVQTCTVDSTAFLPMPIRGDFLPSPLSSGKKWSLRRVFWDFQGRPCPLIKEEGAIRSIVFSAEAGMVWKGRVLQSPGRLQLRVRVP